MSNSFIVKNNWWNDTLAEKIWEYLEEEIPNWHGLTLEQVRENIGLSAIDIIDKYHNGDDIELLKENKVKARQRLDTLNVLRKIIDDAIDIQVVIDKRSRQALVNQYNMDDPHHFKNLGDGDAQNELFDIQELIYGS